MRGIATAVAAALFAAWPAFAHDMAHMDHMAMEAAQQPATAIPDVPVLDQNGKRLNFYSDLVRGRTVAIDFIYTECTTICPMQTTHLRMVQDRLAARIGKDIALISISIDPVTDTPPS